MLDGPRRSKAGLERGVGNRQVLAPAALWVQQGEPVAALLSVPTGDAPVSDERIARVVELPGGVGELGRHRQQRLHLGVTLAVQVPPARPVRDEVQAALRAPLGLHDRLVRATSDVAGWTEPPV